MNAGVLAQVIFDVYSSGHIKQGSKKLVYEDFLQLVYVTMGSLLYDMYKEELMQGIVSTIVSVLQPYILDVKKDGYNRKYSTLPGELVVLPENSGLFSLVPVSSDFAGMCEPILPSSPGSEWAICKDDSGSAYYIPYGNELRYFNLPEGIDKIEATMIVQSEDAIVPSNLRFKIAQVIWREVIRTLAIPIDKINDGNPNIDEIFKTKLSSPELNAG